MANMRINGNRPIGECITDNQTITDLIDMLITADHYVFSDHCTRHDEITIEGICEDTYRLLADIIIRGLAKDL